MVKIVLLKDENGVDQFVPKLMCYFCNKAIGKEFNLEWNSDLKYGEPSEVVYTHKYEDCESPDPEAFRFSKEGRRVVAWLAYLSTGTPVPVSELD